MAPSTSQCCHHYQRRSTSRREEKCRTQPISCLDIYFHISSLATLPAATSRPSDLLFSNSSSPYAFHSSNVKISETNNKKPTTICVCILILNFIFTWLVFILIQFCIFCIFTCIVYFVSGHFPLAMNVHPTAKQDF